MPRSATLRRDGMQLEHNRSFLLCIAPSLAVLTLMTLVSALYLLLKSFTQLDLMRPPPCQ